MLQHQLSCGYIKFSLEKNIRGVVKRNNNTIHSCVCLDELNDHEEVVGYPYKIYSIVKDPYSRILSTYINKIEDGGTLPIQLKFILFLKII